MNQAGAGGRRLVTGGGLHGTVIERLHEGVATSTHRRACPTIVARRRRRVPDPEPEQEQARQERARTARPAREP